MWSLALKKENSFVQAMRSKSVTVLVGQICLLSAKPGLYTKPEYKAPFCLIQSIFTNPGCLGFLTYSYILCILCTPNNLSYVGHTQAFTHIFQRRHRMPDKREPIGSAQAMSSTKGLTLFSNNHLGTWYIHCTCNIQSRDTPSFQVN